MTKGAAKVKISFERFVSAAFKELYANRIYFENLSATPVELEVTSFIDANVFNEDANYDQQFWQVLAKKANQEEIALKAQTIANPFGVPQFTTLMTAEHHTDLAVQTAKESDKAVSLTLAGQLAAGESKVFEKRVIVVTSRDYEDADRLDATASDLLAKQSQQSFDTLKAAQVAAWAKRWAKADVVIEGDDEAQQDSFQSLPALLNLLWTRCPSQYWS